MAIAKTIEIISESSVSWEDAAKKAVEAAGKTVKNITGLYVKDQKAVIAGGSIKAYRLHTNITFVVEG